MIDLETCGSCNGDLGPSLTFPWHFPNEDCRAIRPPAEPDLYGRLWPDVADNERCRRCGQPDNCDNCNHSPLSSREVVLLGGIVLCCACADHAATRVVYPFLDCDPGVYEVCDDDEHLPIRNDEISEIERL